MLLNHIFVNLFDRRQKCGMGMAKLAFSRPLLDIFDYIWEADTIILKNPSRPFFSFFCNNQKRTQPAITCSKLTVETLELGVKYV